MTRSLCIQSNQSAQIKMKNLPYPDKAILKYCKKVMELPAWQDIRSCYNVQVPMKVKYEGLAESRRDRASDCENKIEAQNWIKKVNCIKPGGANFPGRDAYNMGVRDIFINR